MNRTNERLAPFLATLLAFGTVGLAAAQTPGTSTAAPARVVSDPATSAQDHLALAASYDSRIKDLDGVIAEHERMKRDQRRYYINEKLTPKKRMAEMDRHCDAIIQDTRKLQKDLGDLAAWHRTLAADLQSK